MLTCHAHLCVASVGSKWRNPAAKQNKPIHNDIMHVLCAHTYHWRPYGYINSTSRCPFHPWSLMAPTVENRKARLRLSFCEISLNNSIRNQFSCCLIQSWRVFHTKHSLGSRHYMILNLNSVGKVEGYRQNSKLHVRQTCHWGHI